MILVQEGHVRGALLSKAYTQSDVKGLENVPQGRSRRGKNANGHDSLLK